MPDPGSWCVQARPQYRWGKEEWPSNCQVRLMMTLPFPSHWPCCDENSELFCILLFNLFVPLIIIVLVLRGRWRRAFDPFSPAVYRYSSGNYQTVELRDKTSSGVMLWALLWHSGGRACSLFSLCVMCGPFSQPCIVWCVTLCLVAVYVCGAGFHLPVTNDRKTAFSKRHCNVGLPCALTYLVVEQTLSRPIREACIVLFILVGDPTYYPMQCGDDVYCRAFRRQRLVCRLCGVSILWGGNKLNCVLVGDGHYSVNDYCVYLQWKYVCQLY